MLKSKLSDAFEQPGAPKPLQMPLQTISTFEARTRIERARASEYMSYPVGQIVGDMKGETTVKEIVYGLLNELIDSTERLHQLVHAEG
jgi:NAD(P)H-dependent flavin oxidoreductase YrpB (nitropropane dioxygenase family)